MASSSLVGGLRTFRKWMFDVQAFEGSFQGGIVSDMEPWQTPVGGSVQLRDFLTDNTGKLRKRGGDHLPVRRRHANRQQRAARSSSR